MSKKITAIQAQKRNKERVNIYLDGEFAFGLTLLDAAHLYIGKTLSDEEITHLTDQDDIARAKESAVRFLAQRPRSTAEIRRRLAKKGFNPSSIDIAIDRLQELDYVNDLEFARYWVQNRDQFKPRGEYALRYELRQKGIADQLIDQVLADHDWQALALRSAEKKARSLRNEDRQTARHKLGQYLSRRGFDYETIQSVVDQVIEEASEDEYFPMHDE